MKRSFVFATICGVLALVGAGAAPADSIGPITFEPTAYTVDKINGQNGWMKAGPYDAAVVAVSAFPAASGYGFGVQALRISNAVTSGSLGDQTLAPLLTNAAGEASGSSHFEASFSIGTALAAQQPGLALSVSPDDGTGGRMSFLRFEDRADGVHVFFDDVTDPGPVGTTATFNEHDLATLDRAHSHTIRISIDFVSGPGNDVVKVYLDGVLRGTGGSWENYYRYDPGQAANGNVVPVTRTLMLREGGSVIAAPATLGNGFLVDDVSYASSNVASANARSVCKHGEWRTFSNPSFKNQGRCVAHLDKRSGHQHHGHGGNRGKRSGDDNDQGRTGSGEH